jgi:hypothetical protein
MTGIVSDELVAEVEAIAVDRKVIDMFTRQPFVIPDEYVADGEPDKDLVTALKELLKQAEAGALRGFAAFSWRPESGSFASWFVLPPNEEPREAGLKFIGGLEMLKGDIQDMIYEEVYEADQDAIDSQ